MFGFRNRKKYNGTVDTKLNNEYGIKTQGNSNFPGAIAYFGMIDAPFNNGATWMNVRFKQPHYIYAA